MNLHHTGLRHVARLVVAPHAGDEVLGCGAMLARHGDDSAVVILADPDELRRSQLRTAQRMLGDVPTTCLGLPGRRLADDIDRIVRAVADLIIELQPAELYLPYPSLQHDHLIAYEAGIRSTRAPLTHQAVPPVSVLVYDVGAVGPADYPADIHWSVREPLLEEDIDRKVAAAMAYRSPLAHRLKGGAQEIGAAVGLPWAEQFALVRSPRRVARRPEPAAVAMAGGVR